MDLTKMTSDERCATAGGLNTAPDVLEKRGHRPGLACAVTGRHQPDHPAAVLKSSLPTRSRMCGKASPITRTRPAAALDLLADDYHPRVRGHVRRERLR